MGYLNNVNWQSEIEKRKAEFIKDTQNLLQIKSVLDETDSSESAPFGKNVKAALDYMLKAGEDAGFIVKNVENVAGHIEFGEGEELVGILCHVDVVPEGDGWSTDPFAANIIDGKIYARGALDDKGPTMAAFYAMKIIKELGFSLQKRVRMIIGTDEESDWRCVDKYFEVEEMPTIGFAPDADFPIIFAEKGIWDFSIIQSPVANDGDAAIKVLEFHSGRRTNMVPDYAIALLETEEMDKVAESFAAFLTANSLVGKATGKTNGVQLELKGISAHAMEPNNGVNAGLHLAAFLHSLQLDAQAQSYFSFIQDYIVHDSRGERLGIAYKDSITGELTMNPGVFQYVSGKESRISFSMRYPVTYNWANGKVQLGSILEPIGFRIQSNSHTLPHHVEKDSFLIQTLQKVYEAETGEKAELLSIGGGTYARSLKEGVAFGPLFPGREDIAHQKDEYMYIDDLLKAAAIYAHAIYELAR